LTTFIELKPGQELAIGDDIVLALLPPLGWMKDGHREPRIGIACPREVPVRREELPPPARPACPALDALPGVTRRPGPPVQRRPAKGGRP
jgi:sRNA-binding carbon storage regulator CsrA